MSSTPLEIALCGFMHSGVEWLEKILNVLTQQTAGTSQPDVKIINFINTLPHSLPSSWSPAQRKIVFIVRNPKDVAAASYSVNMGYNEDAFSGFLDNFVSSGSMGSSAVSWFDHTQRWGDFLKELPAPSVHVVYFENLVKNFRDELVKLYTFLKLPYHQSHLEQCYNTLNIDEIIQNDGPHRKRRKTEDSKQASHIAITYESGTWKRLFTVGQSEGFDNYVRTAMKNSPISLDVYL